jgi:hypothetical protein
MLAMPGIGKPRHDAEAAEPGTGMDRRQPAVEQSRVAAELVDDDPRKPRAFPVRQKGPCADDLGDGAAALDIRDQRDRHVGSLGETHVGDIAVAQVDLGGAAGPFHQNQVGAVLHTGEAVQHQRQQRVRRHAGPTPQSPLHHDLRPAARRLDQHRVHIRDGRDSGGARLQRLGTADLATIGRNCRIV